MMHLASFLSQKNPAKVNLVEKNEFSPIKL
jgi:hypothetical protein